ncbi:unnamed protein product, partial [Coregonus sp. 'balchen']
MTSSRPYPRPGTEGIWLPLNHYPSRRSSHPVQPLRGGLGDPVDQSSSVDTSIREAHLVAAFEQSLGNMTIRLKSLTMTAEHKDCELNELRKNIELLKKQNNVAQAAINGVINTPELTCKQNRTGGGGSNGSPQQQQQPDLRMRRQHSSDSVSSIASATSHSKHKLKSRPPYSTSPFPLLLFPFFSLFLIYFSLTQALPHSCLPPLSSCFPLLPVCFGSVSSHFSLTHTYTHPPLLSVSLPLQLRSSFKQAFSKKKSPKEKEMKLTDIRLEALSSAHQLDQLREAMNHMQGEIEKLKAENDRLKLESTGGSRAPSQASISSSPSHHTHTPTPGPGLSQHSINLTESTSLDMLLDDTVGDGVMRKEGRHVKIVVSLDEDLSQEVRPRHFLIGCIGVSGKTKWDVLDGVVRRLFKEYITHVDPVSQLGLTCDSVEGYNIGDVHRHSNTSTAHTPELLPCGYLRYVSLLREHRRVILSGPSGTGKTHLANHLARHLLLQEGRPLTPHSVVTFNVDHKSSKVRSYAPEAPHRSIGHQLAKTIYCVIWVLCANHLEPVKGFLGRYLRRKLIETEISSRKRTLELVKIIDWIPRGHASSCHVPWTWLAPGSAWEDPARWVIDSYPWSATPTPADWPPLLQLRPEDVGFDGYSAPREGIRKEPPQSDSDADPLMNMLMRLKEAATSSSPQRYDSDSNSNSHQHDILDSSLEST